MLQEGIVQ